MKIYYGWCIVAISILALSLAIGASIQAFGLFVLPVSREFHLTRAEVNTGAILFNVGMAAFGPVLGRVLDRQSARLMMIASALLFAASMIALGLSHTVWLSAAVIAVPLAAAAVGAGTVTSPTLVARWFTVYRGRAMAIAMMGVSLGPVVVVPLIGLLIEAVGWRQSLVIVGAIVGLALVLLALLVRERPGPGDVEAPRDAHRVAHATEAGDGIPLLGMGALLRLPQFWTIALSTSLAFGIIQVVIVSLVPYGQQEGLSLAQGASLMSMYGVSAIFGALLLAWLGDRFDRLRLLVLLMALFAAAGAAFQWATAYPAMLACTGIFGMIAGMITPAFLALLADRFGAASFGTANGTASFLSTVISAACIRAAGEMFDRTGSYSLTFVSIGAIGVLAAATMFLTNPVSRPLRT
jgi:MFS family permease